MNQFQGSPQLASYHSSGEDSMSEEEDEEDWDDDVDGEGETEEDS